MNESIYEAPQSIVAPADGELTKIYSPNQIFGGSLWGGPIAVTYLLWKNYLALEKVEQAQKTLVAGAVFIVAVLLVLPFLPESFPNMVIPIAYSFAAKQLALSNQLDKKQIRERENHSFQSSWKVFGIGTLTLLLFLIASILLMFGLELLGVID